MFRVWSKSLPLLGEELEGMRMFKKLTRKQVAEQLGISLTYYADIVNGNRKPTKKETIIKLAGFLEMSNKDVLYISVFGE